MRHHRPGLTGVGHFSCHEIIEALGDAVRNTANEVGALVHRQGSPGTIERGACGRHGSIDFCAATFGNMADQAAVMGPPVLERSEEHTSELQSLMRISYAVFCLKKKKENHD